MTHGGGLKRLITMLLITTYFLEDMNNVSGQMINDRLYPAQSISSLACFST